jgi:hypothetical protein
MKTKSIVGGAAALLLVLSTGSALNAAEKAKAQKVAGDIGLLDTEKNYMIVVTKEGKLVTIDYTNKTKVTAMVPSKAKMSDIGLGSAASVQYVEKGGKNHLTAIEYISKK